MAKFLSHDRASLLTEQEQYEYRIKDTIYETESMKENRMNALNEINAGDSIASQVPPELNVSGLFKFIDKILKGVLGALGAVLGAGAAALAKAIAIKKLKNSMLKFVDWTEYGWHGKKGKAHHNNLRYFRSEADKDRECYFSHEQAAERDMLKITQQLMKTAGLTNLQ